MATVIVTLKHGLKLGETLFKKITLREPTAGDVIDASEESEKVIVTTNASGQPEPQLIPSPTLVGANVLRRQVHIIGEDIPGPLSMEQIRSLHPEDFHLLQLKAETLEQAGNADIARQEVVQVGRRDNDGKAD